MAESVDALVSNTSRFTPVPVRPRLWVQKKERFLTSPFFVPFLLCVTHPLNPPPVRGTYILWCDWAGDCSNSEPSSVSRWRCGRLICKSISVGELLRNYQHCADSQKANKFPFILSSQRLQLRCSPPLLAFSVCSNLRRPFDPRKIHR